MNQVLEHGQADVSIPLCTISC